MRTLVAVAQAPREPMQSIVGAFEFLPNSVHRGREKGAEVTLNASLTYSSLEILEATLRAKCALI
jgi:hypothetical protein